MSESLTLQWDWIDFGNRRVAWPTSKTGSISKPLSKEAALLLANATILEDEYGQPSPYVCPSVVRPTKPMPDGTYAKAWRRILARAKVPHDGPPGTRHRAQSAERRDGTTGVSKGRSRG